MARTPDLELFWSATARTDSVGTEVALVFCPNCGTQNDSAATPCKNCGFRLSGVSASKFKGTMMLNSDQTVQELIEEHKKKKADAALDPSGKPLASSPPAAGSVPPKPSSVLPPPSGAPPSSGMTGTTRPVFQPPRAGAPKRRMGGTMLGVAPQVGGVTPRPEVTASPSSVQVEPSRQEHLPSLGGDEGAGELTPAPQAPAAASLPLAGTVAMPVVPEAAPLAPGAPLPERAAADPAQPLVVPDAFPEAARHLDVEGPQDHAGRAPAATAPLPQYNDGAPDLALEDPSSPKPRRIRPFEIALIVLTCGLYGIVVLLRQRKSPIP